MRLTDTQINKIRELTRQVAGDKATVRVFGSRLDDTARGGDLDLFVELPESVSSPAQLAANLAARVSRMMHGRKIDVVLYAPNLEQLPIHDIARREGVLL